MALTKLNSASVIERLPVGSVIQTKSFPITSGVTKPSSATNAYVDLGLSLAITPQYASSKILVMINASLGTQLGTGHFRLVRDSTVLNVGDSASNRLQSSVAIRDSGTPYTLNIQELSIYFLDNPSTTSEITYKLQGTLGATYNGVVYLNRTHTDTDADYGSRCASNITLQEISV
jgi:hypothetical protein